MKSIRKWFGSLGIVINGHTFCEVPLLEFEAVSCFGSMSPSEARALASCLIRAAEAIELEAKK